MKFVLLFVITFQFVFTCYAQKQVTFLITYDGINNKKKIKPVSYNYVTNKFQFYVTKIIKIDSLHEKVIVFLKQPVEINIAKHIIFVESGQLYHVKYFLKKDSIVISGKYSGNSKYADLIDNSKFSNIIFSDFKGNEIKLKEALQDVRNQKLAKIDSLFKLNVMSLECHKYLFNEIYYSHILSLIDIGNSLSIENSSKKLVILDEVKTEKFKDSTKLSSKFYGFAMSSLCTDILTHRDAYEYTVSHLKRSTVSIKSKFKGIQREFLLSYLFRRYCRKQLADYKNDIDSLYVELTSTLKNVEYKSVVSYWYEYYNKANKVIPDLILNAQLYTQKNDSITLRSLIQKDKLNIIDFWASWCSPCIKQINKYNEKIGVINMYNIIFVSIDEDINLYLQSSNKLKINSYLLSPFNTKFVNDYFAIPPIPRTVLIENMVIKECDFDFNSFLEMR